MPSILKWGWAGDWLQVRGVIGLPSSGRVGTFGERQAIPSPRRSTHPNMIGDQPCGLTLIVFGLPRAVENAAVADR
jgi:hypothetical protein